MLKAELRSHTLHFEKPGGTSRGILTEKPSWFILVWEKDEPAIKGVGECSIIRGLSHDDRPDLLKKLKEVVQRVNDHEQLIAEELVEFPSIRFALETALQDLSVNGSKELFPSAFTSGAKAIDINGLIWMGKLDHMKQQVQQKIQDGFGCIKLKIGALDWDREYEFLKGIRAEYPADQIEIRVDANGAFSFNEAPEKLDRLAEIQVHSIEQPIKAGKWKQMGSLCQRTPVPIALDEELIGINDPERKKELLDTVEPQYIILKPSLVGGFHGTKEWIDLAEEREIPWWNTSALESNIGLNAIAQWTYKFKNPLPQGLGTGGLFTNNIIAPLNVENGQLHYDPASEWDLGPLFESKEDDDHA